MKALFYKALKEFGLCVVVAFAGFRCRGQTILTNCSEATLRDAVALGGPIKLGCSGTILLNRPLVVTNSAEIDAGTNEVVLNGQRTNRIFVVQGADLRLVNLQFVDARILGKAGIQAAIGPEKPVPGESVVGGAILASNANVTLVGCVISNSVAEGGAGEGSFSGVQSAAGGYGSGGGIYASGGKLDVTASRFLNCAAKGGAPFDYESLRFFVPGGANGGAIATTNCIVSISTTEFSGNFAQPSLSGYRLFDPAPSGIGGALSLVQSGAVLSNCVFSGNAVLPGGGTDRGQGLAAEGGAVFSDGALRIYDSTFRSNSVSGATSAFGPDALGGAVASHTFLEVSGSSFLGNRVVAGGTINPKGGTIQEGQSKGGALYGLGRLSVTNCTFLGNSASTPENSGVWPVTPPPLGGAIFAGATNGTIAFSTIATNLLAAGAPWTVPTDRLGAGLFVDTNATVLVKGCVFSGNSVPRGQTNASGAINLYGAFSDAGYNFSSDGSVLSATSSRTNVDIMLGPLGEYGGVTPTLPLLGGSPAIDGGPTDGFPLTDQRGRNRFYGSASDSGAFESSPPFRVTVEVTGTPDATLRANEAIFANSGNREIGLDVPAGLLTLTPSETNYVFAPATISTNINSDVFGVSFRGYELGALAIENTSLGLSIVFAPRAAGEYQLEESKDLAGWARIKSQKLEPEQLWRSDVSFEDRARFYRLRSQ